MDPVRPDAYTEPDRHEPMAGADRGGFWGIYRSVQGRTFNLKEEAIMGEDKDVSGQWDFGDFGDALSALRRGGRVARKGWNGKGMWLALQVPDAQSKMTLPYIFMSTVTGDLVPWLASQTDILAHDWTEVPATP